MHTPTELLDALKKKHGLPSDRQAALMLDLTPAAVSIWRSNKGKGPSDETAIKLAKLLDMPEDYILLCVYASRADNDETKKIFRQIAGRIKRGAAVAVLGLTGFLGISQAPPARAGEATSPGLYILSNRRKGLLPAT